jgi:hypothetical protein
MSRFARRGIDGGRRIALEDVMARMTQVVDS